jgi:hypothetical protein
MHWRQQREGQQCLPQLPLALLLQEQLQWLQMSPQQPWQCLPRWLVQHLHSLPLLASRAPHCHWQQQRQWQWRQEGPVAWAGPWDHQRRRAWAAQVRPHPLLLLLLTIMTTMLLLLLWAAAGWQPWGAPGRQTWRPALRGGLQRHPRQAALHQC